MEDRRIIPGEVVRITEFSVAQETKTLVEEYLFARCIIEGPAILMPADNTRFMRPRFDPWDPGAIIWLTSPTRPLYVGVVRVTNSIFEQCLFRGIGVAMPENRTAEFIAEAERGMAEGEPHHWPFPNGSGS